MDYYKQTQHIAEVDKNDKIIGKIEKWEAHKKGVLHRAFTMILYYQEKIVLQHRKHPVFDGYFDLSSSSHQIFVPPSLSSRATPSSSRGSRGITSNDILEDDLTAIYKTLKREWNLNPVDLKDKPKLVKKIYYKAKDPNSEFSDHEIDYIYEGTLKKIPTPNYDFAYGFSLIEKKGLLKSKVFNLWSNQFAPWVKVMIEEKLIK